MAEYRIPSWKKLAISLIPNIQLWTGTPLGGRVRIRARTHKGLLALRIRGYKRHALHEDRIFQCLDQLFDGSGTFFDIGANVGVYTIPLALRCRRNGGKVVAFEPEPENVELLRQSFAYNGVEQVAHIEMCAVGAASGEADFFRDKLSSATGTILNGSGNSLYHRWAGLSAETITVQAITLDQYIRERQITPDIIKIDVEGAESLVLKGAQACLKDLRPVILIDGFDVECYETLRSCSYEMTDLLASQTIGSVGAAEKAFTVLAKPL